MTPTATTTATTVAEVLDAVDAFLPIVRDNIGRIRSGRRLPDDVELAMRATGINRLALPASLGGLEARPADAMRVFERIAAVDGSTAWCAIIGAASNIFAGYLPPDGAREVFADPDRSSATVFAALGTLDVSNGSARSARALAVRQQLPARRLDGSRRDARVRRRQRRDAAARVRAGRRTDDRGHVGRGGHARHRQPPRLHRRHRRAMWTRPTRLPACAAARALPSA